MRTDVQIMADAADGPAFSNRSEYDYWADGGRGCYDCANDDQATETWCPILSVALLGKWPAEWARRVHRPDPTSTGFEIVDECSEFLRRPDDGDDDGPKPPPAPTPPAAQLPGQADIFEVFADQIVEQIKQQAPAQAVSA
jgi:hypothetical protein